MIVTSRTMPARPSSKMLLTNFKYLICIMLIMQSCVPLTQSSGNSSSNPKVLSLTDKAYEPQIRTILLHPNGAPLLPAVTQLGEWNLMLEFDDLKSQNETYYARVQHCNYDWSPSSLQHLDYMTAYNEFPINNYEFSVDTHIPYVHYWMQLPAVKLPGNYVLVVYRGSDKDDIILSRRFMVFDSQVTFSDRDNLIGPGALASLNQQINFTVKYANMNILNPQLDVHVNIRQNQRWDNAAVNVRPSFVRELDKALDYRFFDEATMFKGGNEFRFFDLRSLNFPGRNVASINKTVKPFEAYIQTDKTKEGQAYSQYNDIDGSFRLDNYDYKNIVYSNYVNVNFALSTPPIKGDVYVTGAFNYWSLNDENKMHYDSARSKYVSKIMLKQGWYDYQYYVKSKTLPPLYFEGSHYETENFYEIFVYYRPFQPQADLLVGYMLLEKNPR
jgi:hypothetical protein